MYCIVYPYSSTRNLKNRLMKLYRIVCVACAVLFSALFIQLLFYPESFITGVGMETSSAAIVVTRRASVLMLGLAFVLFSSLWLQSTVTRRLISGSMALVMFGLAALGSYELYYGTVSSAIKPAIVIELVFGLSFLVLVFRAKSKHMLDNQVKLSRKVSSVSILPKYVGNYDYCDRLIRPKTTMDDIETIAKALFVMPKWANTLLYIRNFVVKPFGLYTSDQRFNGLPFPELASTHNEILLHYKDKHLNAWISVLRTDETVEFTTVVCYNMLLGKIYFNLIKAFHILLIKKILQRL